MELYCIGINHVTLEVQNQMNYVGIRYGKEMSVLKELMVHPLYLV
jgi:hypothetical protein